MLQFVDFLSDTMYLARETTLVAFCLLFCTSNPFCKGFYSKRKDFDPKVSKFLPFRVGSLFCKDGKIIMIVIPPMKVSIYFS